MFVSKEPVAVEDGDNTIFIKPKMDYATRSAVIGAAMHIEAGGAGEVDVGAYQMALLTHNIVKWKGPAFAGVPCNATTIGTLDPDEPLVARVLEAIAERNPQGKAPPSAPTDGSDSSAA